MRLFTRLDFSPRDWRIAAEFVSRPLAFLVRSLVPPIAAAALAAALPALAQDTASQATTGYSVRGTVVNAINGQAIPRALVALNQDQAMLTNGDGEFSFENVAAGEYSVSVQKPGYQGFGNIMPGMQMRVSMGGGHRIVTPPRHIQVGPDMPALTFPVTPLAMIAGHVTLSSADPADGIQVQVLARQFSSGRAHWAIVGRARTRSDGSFRVAGLDPGSYMVSTQASLDRPGQAASDRTPVWGYPAMYYPGVTDFSAAGILTLAAGQQAEADLSLVRQQFFPVTALVHSSSEMPANFQILDSGGRPTGLSATWDRRDEVVRATAPNGTWTMEAHAYGRATQWGSASFQVNGAPVSFSISVLPVPTIPVIIRREALASADSSQPAPSGPGMNLMLVAADEIGTGIAGGGLNPVEGSGGTQWQLSVNEPGRYWVDAQAFPPTYISSITSGGVDLGSNPLIIVPGSTPSSIEVTLRNDAGTISGQIASQTANAAGTSGAPPAAGERPQTWIYAIPLFSTAARLPEGSVQANGQFTIPDLAPGSYRVVACDAQQEIDFHSAEGLAAWAGKGETVTVDPGGTASVELDVLHIEAAQ